MLEFLMKIVIGSTLILAVSLVVEYFLRKARPETRHTLWIAALLGVLFFPLLTPLLPSIALVTHIAEEPTPVMPISVTDMSLPMPRESFVTDISVPIDVPEDEFAAVEIETVAEVAPLRIPWPTVFSVIWLTGIAIGLVRFVISLRTLKKIEKHAQKETDSKTLDMLESIRREFGVTKAVEILRSEAVQVPFASGIFRSKIFLPFSLRKSDETLRAVLMHEMAHLRRRDPLWQLLAQFVRIAYWFQPLVYVAGNRIRTERELACDRIVLESHTDAEHYASVLLEMNDVVRRNRHLFPACAVAMASMHPLERRIRAILDFRPGSPATRRGAAFVILLMLLTTAIAAALTPSETVEKKTDENIEQNAISENHEEPVTSPQPLYPKPTSPADLAVPVHVDLPEGVKAEDVEIYTVQIWRDRAEKFSHGNYSVLPNLSLRPDRKYVVYAYTKDGKYVSDFATVLNAQGISFNFKLVEAVPLSGTLKFRDGKPVDGHPVKITVNFAIYGEPDGEFEFSRTVQTDKNGEYSIHLPPGDKYIYMVTTESQTEPVKTSNVKLSEGARSVVDFTIRDAFYIRLLHADGRPVFEKGASRHALNGFTWKEGRPVNAQKFGPFAIGYGMTVNDDGNIRYFPYDKSNFFHFMTDDQREGILHDFTGNVKNGEIVELRLEPTAKVKFRLQRKDTGRPLADEFLQNPVKLFLPGPTRPGKPLQPFFTYANYTTDKDGSVTAHVPSLGKYAETESLKYTLNFQVEGSTGFTFRPNSIFAPTKPGEEMDLGTFEVLFRPPSSGKTLTRTVLLPDGKPAVGATVCLGTFSLRLSPPRLLVVADGPPAERYVVARTDENGRFSMPEPGEKDYQICFVHPDGYAQVNNRVFTEQKTFSLQKYASLEIRIPYDPKPEARNEISLGQPSTPESRANDPTFPQLEYQAKIPESGIVKIAKIAPGEFGFSKLAMNATNTWYYGAMSVSVKLEPGETKILDLRNPVNVRVKGRIRLPKDFDGDFTAMDWSRSFIELSSDAKVPKEESRQYCLTLAPSAADPREAEFVFDGIAPGGWNRRIYLFNQNDGKNIGTEIVGYLLDYFVIPEPSKETKDAVHDLGTIDVPLQKPALKEGFVPKKTEETPQLGLFQTEENGKEIWMLRGRVLYPDGSPAAKVRLSYRHDGNFYVRDADENGYFTETRGIRLSDKNDRATFQMCGVVPGVENDAATWPWVVLPTILDNPRHQPQEKFVFRLEKGCPIVVDVRFDTGYVPKYRHAIYVQNHEKSDAENAHGAFQFGTFKDKTGFYRAALLPGRYDIFCDQTPWKAGEATVTITEQDVEKGVPKEIVLNMPAPSKIEIKGTTETISSLSRVQADRPGKIGDDGRFRGHTMTYNSINERDSNGRFIAYLSPYFNAISFNNDRIGGVLCVQEPETAGKTYVLNVNAYASGKVRLLSKATGKPITGVKVECDFPFDYNGSPVHTGMQTYVTSDEHGIVELPKMIVGQTYRLTIRSTIKVKPEDQGGPIEVPQGFTATEPGKSYDFGDVRLDGDFSAFE